MNYRKNLIVSGIEIVIYSKTLRFNKRAKEESEIINNPSLKYVPTLLSQKKIVLFVTKVTKKDILNIANIEGIENWEMKRLCVDSTPLRDLLMRVVSRWKMLEDKYK